MMKEGHDYCEESRKMAKKVASGIKSQLRCKVVEDEKVSNDHKVANEIKSQIKRKVANN